MSYENITMINASQQIRNATTSQSDKAQLADQLSSSLASLAARSSPSRGNRVTPDLRENSGSEESTSDTSDNCDSVGISQFDSANTTINNSSNLCAAPTAQRLASFDNQLQMKSEAQSNFVSRLSSTNAGSLVKDNNTYRTGQQVSRMQQRARGTRRRRMKALSRCYTENEGTDTPFSFRKREAETEDHIVSASDSNSSPPGCLAWTASASKQRKNCRPGRSNAVMKSVKRNRRKEEYDDGQDRKMPARNLKRKTVATSSLNRTNRTQTSILMVGCDVMAHILSFLEPPEVLNVLTMPVSKDWQIAFTRQEELWRVLCLLDPFKAQVGSDDCAIPVNAASSLPPSIRKYRLMYSSFVRCMRYLAQVKDAAVHGRLPSALARGAPLGPCSNEAKNSNLRVDSATSKKETTVADGSVVERGRKKKSKRTRIRGSAISNDVLGVSAAAVTGHDSVEQPWSCAIQSILNWMIAFSEVVGIQIMCLKVLPVLLEDGRQRIAAQRTGLTDVVLGGMVRFPNNVQLHTASFHTIVLLARPLGGKEGMLFHRSMLTSSGIFSGRTTTGMFSDGAQNGKSGIAVMLESMLRFSDNEMLQAMSCWSLVNIALVQAQKKVLVKLGGIEMTINAMTRHPRNAEVQFRALFALINLVIPYSGETEEEQQEVDGSIEVELLNERVGQIVDCVVLAMKNFCSNETILNRACLVLHNLSLKMDYHTTLLFTPNCYQLLEWCHANYPSDNVLQQSAAGTINRLQVTLTNNDSLRARFTASLQKQYDQSLEEEHHEAIRFRMQKDANEISHRR